MICDKIIGHNGKIFSCTARVQMCIWALLEIKTYNKIKTRNKKKSHPITIFTFQSLKIKVTLDGLFGKSLEKHSKNRLAHIWRIGEK